MAALRKLGNSTGTIIPASALSIAGFKLGDELTVEAEAGEITLRKASVSYSLDELLEGVTPAMVALDRDDQQWLGSSVGRELVDD